MLPSDLIVTGYRDYDGLSEICGTHKIGLEGSGEFLRHVGESAYRVAEYGEHTLVDSTAAPFASEQYLVHPFSL